MVLGWGLIRVNKCIMGLQTSKTCLLINEFVILVIITVIELINDGRYIYSVLILVPPFYHGITNNSVTRLKMKSYLFSIATDPEFYSLANMLLYN